MRGLSRAGVCRCAGCVVVQEAGGGGVVINEGLCLGVCPIGGMYIREGIPLDSAADGLPLLPRVPFIGKELMTFAGLMDSLEIGGRWAEQRSSRLSKEDQVRGVWCGDERVAPRAWGHQA